MAKRAKSKEQRERFSVSGLMSIQLFFFFIILPSFLSVHMYRLGLILFFFGNMEMTINIWYGGTRGPRPYDNQPAE